MDEMRLIDAEVALQTLIIGLIWYSRRRVLKLFENVFFFHYVPAVVAFEAEWLCLLHVEPCLNGFIAV